MTSVPRADLAAAVEEAVRAPSVHNTQPWLWRVTDGRVELYADPNRHLTAADPDRRDLLMSCGAALHHLRVALAARELTADVARLPDPDRTDLLAVLDVRPGQADPDLVALHPAIARRRTDRRRFSHEALTDAELTALAARGVAEGIVVLPVTGAAVEQLATLLAEAAHRQEQVPGYAAELQRWTHRLARGRDGVPSAGVAAGAATALPMRRFGRARLVQPPLPPGLGAVEDGSSALVVATTRDEPIDALRAGEAASAVLLAATTLGFATTPLSQGLEIADSRHELRHKLLHVPEHPQLVIRLGRPAPGAAELPPTPRRRLEAVLLPG